MSGIVAMTPAARLCLKGRDAPGILAAANLPTPARPNSLARFDDGRGWCLRLGNGEYLLAHDDDAARFASIGPALLRSDRCLLLRGRDATARLLQVCDIDERPLQRQPDSLALVFAADVSVTLHSDGHDADGPRWRLWCDPTWFDHLHAAVLRTAPHEARS